MEPEENVEVEVEESSPEEDVEQFALDVADKAKMVESGDMTVRDFVSECMEQLGTMEVADEAPAMGGLGSGGDFPNLEDLESEA